MNSSIESLRSKSAALKEKRTSVFNHLLQVQKSLAEIFEGLPLSGSSKDVNLQQYGEDDYTYGHLYFSSGEFKIAHRSTDDDYHDALSGTPDDQKSYDVKPLSVCPAEWLGRLMTAGAVETIVQSLDNKLDEINIETEQSLSSFSRILESQASQIDHDMLDILRPDGDSILLKGWSSAHALVTIEPADSITRSSSYVESVCKKILTELNASIPDRQDMTSLINECVKTLGLSDDAQANNDLKQLVGGIKSICQGIGSLRTHFGTAHGSVIGEYQLNTHYARFVNNSAAAVSIFLLSRHRERVGGRK